MNGKERIKLAMNTKQADRVPLFCQLSLGHYMTLTPFEPYKVWFSPETFGDSLLMLAERYSFDGILVNLPGRQRDWEEHLVKKERKGIETTIHWDDGSYSVCPDNDNVHHFSGKKLPSISEADPEQIFYIEPHDLTGVNYPYYYGFCGVHGPHNRDFFPDYILDALKYVVKIAGDKYHISSEVFSPFTQLMELFDYSNALMALMDAPKKCEKILENLSEGASQLALLQASTGVDAVLVSSAFAGGGFISRDFYRRFVLPYEKNIVEHIHKETDLPIYVHTCGAIGDRIALMVKAGYDGIDTMDPPPLGNTEIGDVKREFGNKIFLKGNLDPVNVLLKGTKEEVYEKAAWLVEQAGRGGGYILSTACSVAPAAPPENIKQLYRASVEHPY